jgi:phosphoribosylamine--glycine ligase / phosphoribosylformylglycinamidine cyclo-ligase
MLSSSSKKEKRHYHSTSEIPVDDNLTEKLDKIASSSDLMEKEKMKLLIIGSGGREYAIAHKLIQQDFENILDIYYTGPSSNAGLNELCADKCISPKTCNIEVILECVIRWNIHLVVIGPEQPLASGIADALHEAGVLCFGPKCKSAQIETSKGFTRKLMLDCNMSEYCPRFLVVNPGQHSSGEHPNQHEYVNFIAKLDGNFVVKPDGLNGGKGVKVSGDHFTTIDEGIAYIQEILSANQSVVIEEKLIGEEFSFMTFTDGISVKHTIPVKDYKRAYENDEGPNTGSMGSITGPNGSLWFLTKDDISLAKQINEMMILYLAEDTNEAYQGVLYGSFIKTSDGLKVIEYNARFGDPECINLLTLMKSNLYDILLSTAAQTLGNLDDLEFSSQASVFKYVVPLGYPNNPVRNEIVHFNPNDFKTPGTSLIYSSITNTNQKNKYIELGSRTLGLISTHESIEDAAHIVNLDLSRLHNIGADEICIDDSELGLVGSEANNLKYKEIQGPLFYRKDIGFMKHKETNQHFFVESNMELEQKDAYAQAGVDIDEGNRVVKEIKTAVESTFTPLVCSEFGDFAGMIQVPQPLQLNSQETDPFVLVASTDGVGTKSILVLETFGPEVGYEMLGNDIVNHCINDVLVKGARPYFFLDYFGAHSIKAEHVKYFVQGVAKACKNVGCALLGGETAEMPAVYQVNHSEVSGTMVGMVRKSQIINGKELIKEGDVILGIPSSGPHTNGYTLIRKLVKEHNPPRNILEQLCATHRSYLREFEEITSLGMKIHGMCHLTGGGFAENPKRILPEELTIQYAPFEYSEIFKYIQTIGNISDKEMQKIFNCGIGMLLFLKEEDAKRLQEWMIINGNLPYTFIGTVLKK